MMQNRTEVGQIFVSMVQLNELYHREEKEKREMRKFLADFYREILREWRKNEKKRKYMKICGNIRLLWHIMIQRGETNDDT
ncbi:MAG: hypothetical protein LIO76_09755 [Clostridiales bacterium]|nr:hypothetical protein [Clostridiales bacterium]